MPSKRRLGKLNTSEPLQSASSSLSKINPPIWIREKSLRSTIVRFSSGQTSSSPLPCRLSTPLCLRISRSYVGALSERCIWAQVFKVSFGSEAYSDSVGETAVQASSHGSWPAQSQKSVRFLDTSGLLLILQVLFPKWSETVINLLSVAETLRFLCRKFFSPPLNFLSSLPVIGQFFATSPPLSNSLSNISSVSTTLAISQALIQAVSPKFHRVLSSIGGALPVTLRYNWTKLKISGPAGGTGFGEKVWRECHRWAAVRLSGLLTELQMTPLLGPLMAASSQVSMSAEQISMRTCVNSAASHWLPGSSDQTSISLSLEWPIPASAADIAEPSFREVQELEGADVAGDDLEWMKRFIEQRDDEVLEYFAELKEVQEGFRGLIQNLSLFLRACWLAAIFLPYFLIGGLLYAVSYFLEGSRKASVRWLMWRLLRFCLEQCGAAFIKWGQWSATREDLFSEDMCATLSSLHDKVPSHGYGFTKREVQKSFGRPISELFDSFERVPVASGSIAQVHRAILKNPRPGEPASVAVKVRHPSVALRIYQDFQIMGAMADIVDKLPLLQWLNLRESVDQFSHTMTAQADLRFEAYNLMKFHRNFQEASSGCVVFPKLIPRLVTEAVIVESFENGLPLHKFLKRSTNLNTQIAAIGVDTYLKMILKDNFVHTDLHPGNIMARMSAADPEKVEVVILDFGLAEKLSPTTRYHFLSLILMICKGNGVAAASHLLHFSAGQVQRCPSPNNLKADMKRLFDRHCQAGRGPIDLNFVLKSVLKLCYHHQVTIDSSYASLVVSVCVIAGFAQSLDPELNILDAATPCLFMYNLTGQILGRVYG